MKPATIIGVASLLLVLQSATFAYVVSMERRMSRVETIIDLQQRSAPRMRDELADDGQVKA